LSSSDPKDTVLEAAIKLNAQDLLRVMIPLLLWNTDDPIQTVKSALLKNI